MSRAEYYWIDMSTDSGYDTIVADEVSDEFEDEVYGTAQMQLIR